MNSQIKSFIQGHKDLIQGNTKEDWNIIYQDLYKFSLIREEWAGEFTQIMLSVGIDPAQIMQRIPEKYLFKSNIPSYNIPINVTIIGNSSFRKCTNLKNVYIPDSVVNIGSAAFDNCENLSFVSIPNKIEYFGKALFWNCKELESIQYRGTIEDAEEQINKYKLSVDFTFGSKIKKLICTDGELIFKK